MNKSGEIMFDWLSAILVLFVFILTLAIGFVIWSNFNNVIQETDTNIIDNSTKSKINNFANYFILLDNLIPFLFLVLWFSVILASLFSNPLHPAFFIISLIVLFLVSFVGILFHDTGILLFENENFASVKSDLNNTMFFINYFHIISFGIGLVTSVIFYSRRSSGENTGIE